MEGVVIPRCAGICMAGLHAHTRCAMPVRVQPTRHLDCMPGLWHTGRPTQCMDRKSLIDRHLSNFDARNRVLWLLIGCFLLQPVIVYLATPMPGAGRDGVHTLICTLQGTREVVLNLRSKGRSTPVDDNDCPALKLLQLVGSAQISVPQAAPDLMLFAIEVLEQTVFRTHRRLPFSAYSSRAPPLA
jgi:hypothetical protein